MMRGATGTQAPRRHDVVAIRRKLHAATADTGRGRRARRRRHALGKAAPVQRRGRRGAGDGAARERVRGVHGRTLLPRLHLRRLRAADGAARLRRLARRAGAHQRLHAVAGARSHRRGGRRGGAGGDHRRPRHRHRRPSAARTTAMDRRGSRSPTSRRSRTRTPSACR